MKVLSLFDGISCGMVALKRIGIKVEKYDSYEIDEYAIKVSKYNHKEINHLGDVFNAKYKKKQYDLLIGGSPCTYWSIAGARKDKEGKREVTSDGFGFELFKQFVRALEEVEPKYFLYENNESMSDEIKEEITKYLKVEPIMINSNLFSAQNRKRYYWTNINIKELPISNETFFKDIILENSENKISSFEKYKDTVKVSKDGMTISWDTSGKGNYSQQNRARYKEQKFNTLPASGDDKNNIYLGEFKFRRIDPIEAERMQNLEDNYSSVLKSKSKRVSVCGNGWTVDVIAHILSGIKNEGEN